MLQVASMAIWDPQRCSSCGNSLGCSSYERLSVVYTGGKLQSFSLRRRRGQEMQLIKAPGVTRSMYSPLVDSFGSTQNNLTRDLNSFSKSNHSGSAWNPTPASTEHPEQSGDAALADMGHDIDMRSARARPPTMSLSQGLSSSGRLSSVTHTIGAVGRPVNANKLPGPMGFAMAFAVAALGLKTAVEKQGFLPSTPQKACETCDGYGVQQCHVCRGRGVLTWEGKLRHTDPCPLCFGSCVKKCSSCGGMKLKKGMPPAAETKLAGSNRK